MYKISSTYICITQLLVPTKPTHKHIAYRSKSDENRSGISKYRSVLADPAPRRPHRCLYRHRTVGNRRITAGNHRFTDVYRRPRQAGGRASDSRSYLPASAALPAINIVLKPKSTGISLISPELGRKGWRGRGK